MGCVQSLFNPSKSRSPSPEKEFVPPTFETVVVTRQPKKTSTKSAEHQEQARRSAGGDGLDDLDLDDDDDDDDDDIVSKCDDFEKHALDDNGDGASVHYVEATAVRTLAANTGSVAILGTTAKCKSAGGSPALRQPPVDRQQTWSPSTATSEQQQPGPAAAQRPQLETRYVEATAVRTLAAETGSIAILGTTADPKAKPRTADAETGPAAADDDAGSVHYVRATAVRQLAAETGSIAILASTATVAGGPARPRSQQPAQRRPSSPTPQPCDPTGDDDAVAPAAGRDPGPEPDRMPVGVREVLDSEPGAPETRPALPVDVDPRIPLPVIYAMEAKPTEAAEDVVPVATSPEKDAVRPEKDAVSPEVDAVSSPPPAASAAVRGPVVASSDSAARKPLLRQSNKTSEQRENDDDGDGDGDDDNGVTLSSDTWMPCPVPVFAKCPPAKSKSLPSGNPALTEKSSENKEEKYERQHGVVRGSSLPHDTERKRVEQLMNSTKHTNEEIQVEPISDKLVLVKQSVYEPIVSDSTPKERTTVETTVGKSTMVETTVTETTVVEPVAVIKPTAVEPAEVKPVVDKPDVSKPTVIKPVADEAAAIKPAEVEPVEDAAATVKLVEVKPVAERVAAIKPVEVKPVAEDVAAIKPIEVKPVAEDVAAVKPAEVKLVTEEVVAVKPAEVKLVAEEVFAVKPVEVKPIVKEAAAVKPVEVEPFSDKAAAVKSKAIEPTADEPTAVKPADVKPTVSEPAVVKPDVVETNATGTIVTTEPAAVKPVVGELDAVNSVVDEPVAGKPAKVDVNVTEIITTTKAGAVDTEVDGPVAGKPAKVEANVTEIIATTKVAAVETEVDGPAAAEAITSTREKVENGDAKTVGTRTGAGETTGRASPPAAVDDVGKPRDESKGLQPADSGSMVNGYGRKSEDRDETSGPMVNGGQPGQDDADDEYRLTMIQSVREAVNRICEQAVEKTEAIVKSGRGRYRQSGVVRRRRDVDESEAADCVSSEFSLPPPPPASDPASTAQESSWPPPPPLSEAEEERTIAPGFSFDLPDPPTEMDQMDSETDKLDISDEEMRATGLPSDEDEKTDTEIIGGADATTVMKPTTAVNGGGGGEPAAEKPTAAGPETAAAAADANDGADDRAATTIQAMYRGFRARKYVETVNAAAVKIQAGFRGYRVRQSLKNNASPARPQQPKPAAADAETGNADDNSECWSDDDDDEDQKSVVSVTYAPLKESDSGQGAEQQQKQTGAGGVPSVVAPAGPEAPVGNDDDDDVEALTNAAVKMQARVRGSATRKRLNDEKNENAAADDKQFG